MQEIGVITADIVASRELSPERREVLYAEVRQYLETLEEGKWISNFEVYRGDSLQCVALHKPMALRVALLIRSFIKSYMSPYEQEIYSRYTGKGKMAPKSYFPGKHDIRISIGIGKVDFYSKKDLGHSDGEAFRLSGEGLDSLKNTPYRMFLQTEDKGFNESIAPTIMLLDAVLQKWTNNQAEAVLYRLKDFKEEEISKKVGVSQPAINQRLKTGQWHAIEALLHYFEKRLNSN